MQKIILFLIFIILFSNSLSAICNTDQIDINSASAIELDKIKWVGPATAEKIINARPFESVDELVKVYGIAEGKLNDIKEQGIACVKNQIEETENKEEIIEETVNEKIEEKEIIKESVKKTSQIEEKEVINLNAKTIKTEKNTELSEDNAIYGLIGFCILLSALFVFKKNNLRKNEFR